MVRLMALVLVLSLLIAASTVAETMEATTSDGKKVILFPDGRWEYKEEAPSSQAMLSFKKPSNATEVLKSKKGFVELWYDPNKWATIRDGSNPDAEFQLNHYSGDAQAMVIVERINMPLPALKELALTNAKNVAPDAKIVFEEERLVNNTKMLNMQIEGTIQGISFTYYGYYWTGKAGVLQVITFTGQNLFEELKADFTEFLNGIVILKP